jgi:hypothetical protein
MARKPNYDFERRERERVKAAKTAERAKAKTEKAGQAKTEDSEEAKAEGDKQ